MLEAARGQERAAPTLSLVRGRGETLPFADETFDLVVLHTVLCVAESPEDIARDAVRVTRAGGHMIIGDLGRWSAWALARRLRGWLGSRTWSGARHEDAACRAS
jgi:SAM-dependent methyltransferase